VKRSFMNGIGRVCGSLSLLALVALSGCAPVEGDESTDVSGEEVQANSLSIDFNYSYAEMFDFNIDKFCKDNAPHLLPYAESISHVAGERRVSPRALIALMEQQSHAVSNPAFVAAMPLGNLSKEKGFLEQLRDVSTRLRSAADKTGLRINVSTPGSAILAVVSAGDVRNFGEAYKHLFPEAASQRSVVAQATTAYPSDMQFPWSSNLSGSFGGAHADDGGSGALSSLDFNVDSGSVVVASSGGRVKKHSSCYVEVVHSGGFSTGYYHLTNIRVADGASVGRNAAIANYASTKSQALCEGGSWTGPHVHWTLLSSGNPVSLSGRTISGWTVHPGNFSYDTNCSRMYLIKSGKKWCAN
jgi:murein DD-endopeptidase MepM/ murein hydrolase activator NlpD